MPDITGKRINDLSQASSISNGLNFIADSSDGTKKVPSTVLITTTIDSSHAGSAAEAAEVARFMRCVSAEYDDTATYDVGDYCLHGNAVFRCTTEIATAEIFNSAHWLQVVLASEMQSVAENAVTFTDDGEGNITVGRGA